MKILLLTLFVVLAFIFPDTSLAQDFVTCNGPDCTACNLADMGNVIIKWMFGIIFLIFAGLMMVAGFGLVTSGGNPSALESAKSKFTNAIIGLIIVMAAWLIVDTVMRGLLKGGTGEIEGYGPWAEVKCQTPTVPEMTEADTRGEGETPVPVPGAPADESGMVSLRSMGVNVAAWHGIDGPDRTDKANPSAAAAAKRMQENGLATLKRQPFQVTAAYTKGVGHSSNSQHYKGTAIDFQPINGVTLSQVAALAREAGFTYVLIESKHVHGDMR